jgi:3-hydroxyisobutyrate dehydrogenase
MAANLLRHRGQLTVWNRSPEAADRLRTLGAQVAVSPTALLEECDTVVLMLAHRRAVDEVLGCDGDQVHAPVAGRTVVSTGTISPADSASLGRLLSRHGATYVEAPVSGSRVPAERGALVGMLAGDDEAIDRVEPLLASLCAKVFRCGAVPRALTTKLAVNVFLIDLVTGLTEATRFAEERGVDLAVFRSVLDAGPMASEVSRVKLAKLVEDDFSPQATIRDVRYNSDLILDEARAAGLDLPLLEAAQRLLTVAGRLGHDGADMVATLHALRAGQ